jgi:hypothetical protein
MYRWLNCGALAALVGRSDRMGVRGSERTDIDASALATFVAQALTGFC